MNMQKVSQKIGDVLAILALGAICTAPLAVAQAGSLSPSPELPGPIGDRLMNAVLNHANEISSRRRLTTVFPNEQSPFHGVQMNFVNVKRGNLTFVNRDLVRLDRVPIVFGRVYDSANTDDSDFGPGWKLSVSESIARYGQQLVYTDAGNSQHLLETDGTFVASPHPHLTAIAGGVDNGRSIRLHVAGLVKQFEQIGNRFFLVAVSDKWGNALTLHYDGEMVSGISSQNGRSVSIRRNPAGLIVGASDDAGGAVRYEYDANGRLAAAFSLSGGEWTFAYDDEHRLTDFVDPRDNTVLSARYDRSGNVTRLNSLYDDMAFEYFATHTRIETSLQQAATFWHHESGLTAIAQDFAGHFTQVSFDENLRATALSFDGATIAQLTYAGTDAVSEIGPGIGSWTSTHDIDCVPGRPGRCIDRQPGRIDDDDYAAFDFAPLLSGAANRIATITQTIGDEAGSSALEYHLSGQPSRIVRDGVLVAEYDYDAQGNVIFASDRAGIREYRFSADGLLQEAIMNGERVSFQMDELGRLSGADSGRQNVQLSYDANDQVLDMSFLIRETDFHEALQVAQTYSYGAGGFRTVSEYAAGGETLNSARYRYDDVGNLTELAKHSPAEGESTDVYAIGARNELERVSYGRGGARDFEYDRLGRIARYHSEQGSTAFQYDELGRLSQVSIDGETLLTSDYGPMDTDPVLDADDRTLYTTLDVPVVSAIFGSIESIGYSRPRGATFNAIRFNPTMGRFIVQAPPSPDALLRTSLQRRGVSFAPVDEHMDRHRHLIPLVGDKPSSSLFIPPEYLSVNCAEVECFSFFGRVITTVSAQTVYVGETVYFSSQVGEHAYCYEEWSPGGLSKWRFDHVVYPDSSDWDISVYGYAPNGTPATMSYTYRTAGWYEAWVGPECWTACDAEWGTGRYDTYWIRVLDPPCSVDFSLTSSDSFRISAAPRMPAITATVTSQNPSDASVSWSARVSETVPGTRCSGGPTFSASVRGSGSSFSPVFPGFYGGDLTVTATCSAPGYVSTSSTKTEKITGTQPTDSAIVNRLGTMSSPFEQADLRKIACAESNMTQFGETGRPYYGRGGDLGLMQICYARKSADVWDWTANISSGRAILASSARIARIYLNREVNVAGATAPSNSMLREESIHRYNAGTAMDDDAYREWVNVDGGGGMWVIVDRGGTAEAGLGSYVLNVNNQSATCT